MSAVAVKTCTKCGLVKPLDDFYFDSAKPDGRRPDCKGCVRARTRRFYRSTADRLRPAKRDQMRARRATKKEKER